MLPKDNTIYGQCLVYEKKARKGGHKEEEEEEEEEIYTGMERALMHVF